MASDLVKFFSGHPAENTEENWEGVIIMFYCQAWDLISFTWTTFEKMGDS